MFEATYHPPKNVPREKPKTRIQDINLPYLTPGKYGHMARQPNTDYHVRLLHYKQRTCNLGDAVLDREKNQLTKDLIDIKYNAHADLKRLQGQIKDRFNQKVKEYEASIDARRERLRDLLAKDEQEFYYLTVHYAQHGADDKMQYMKERAEQLRARRETERLKLVEEKRLQQYKDRCTELRPRLEQLHLMDTKHTQLQQIRENEARREAERELETMWNNMMIKEIEAKAEREMQELIHEENRKQDLLETWNLQVQGKELLKQEAERVAEEDRLEMIKLEDQLRKERMEALQMKNEARERCAQELREQIAFQEQLLKQRKKEEEALEQAYAKLAEMEIQREKAAIKDTTVQAKRETALYRKHLKEYEQERKKEEMELLKLLDEYRKQIEAKQLEAKCKEEAARRKLQDEVLKGRAEQLELKRRQAEEDQRKRQEETEMLRVVHEVNCKLRQEKVRSELELAKKYSDDLKRQIEYNNSLRQREKEEQERQLREAQKEEERYQRMVQGFLSGELVAEEKHPFRRVLERFDCYCPGAKK